MAALPFVPKVLKVVNKFLFNETTVGIVRVYEQYTGAPPLVSDLLTLGTLLGAGFNSDLAPVMSPNVSYDSVEITDLSSATSASAEQGFIAHVGTEAGAVIPAAACALMNYGISRRYRGGKPKSFVMFGTDADLLTDQEWETASLDGFLGSWVNFLNIIPINPWPGAGIITQCNVSYYEGFTAVENPITHRYRNVPNVRVTPIVDLINEVSAPTLVHFQTRRGQLAS
jgi:hypothetical protein